MPTRRQERVAKRIVQEAAEALRNLKHVNLGFVTVTKCEVSPDLRQAKIFLSVLGTDEEKERTLRLVHASASRLRGMISRPLGLKVMPQLHFEFDESIAVADRIGRLIRDARQTDANPNPLTPEEAAAFAAAMNKPGREGRPSREEEEYDPFEAVRIEVEDELLGGDDGEDDEDGAWRPIDLDELPADGDAGDDSEDGGE